jgi:hypothetical protein
MRPMQVPSLTPLQSKARDHLYHTTKEPRLRARAQMALLSVEQGLKLPQSAAMVRESEATVWRWLKRYLAEGMEACRMRHALAAPCRSRRPIGACCSPPCADGHEA